MFVCLCVCVYLQRMLAGQFMCMQMLVLVVCMLKLFNKLQILIVQITKIYILSNLAVVFRVSRNLDALAADR